MMKTALVVLFAIVAFCSATGAGPYPPNPPDRQFTPGCNISDIMESFCSNGLDFIELPEDDTVEVYLLRSPVFKARVGPVLGYFHMFHSGVGFKSAKTGRTFDSDFVAVFEVPQATFPNIVKDENGDDDLLWCNDGASCIREGIRYDYWEHLDHATTISGKMFNSWERWMRQHNSTYDEYEIWNLMPKWGQPELYHSRTCFDWCWEMFGGMFEFGAEFPNVLSKDYINLYSHHMSHMNHTASAHKEVVSFYAELHNHLGSFFDFIGFMGKFFKEEKFLHAQGEYYDISNMSYPFVGAHFAPCPLPGQH
eukprot:TRINITY_DN2138_c0_g1_i1.p1 TRINITY_DN2138_c0_g1~~TRINITY_DN2138_c0_g1_i1.p1  ORF type:complete len:308 (-),score=82.17 TRINITY_DN2138_c0_g1_i1:200-1123(-)